MRALPRFAAASALAGGARALDLQRLQVELELQRRSDAADELEAALATVEAERATIDELRERCNGWTHLTVEEASAAAGDAAALREIGFTVYSIGKPVGMK